MDNTAATARQNVITAYDDEEVTFQSLTPAKSGKYTAYLGHINLGTVLRSHGFWYYMIRDQATGRLTEMRGPEDTRKACGEQLRKAFDETKD